MLSTCFLVRIHAVAQWNDEEAQKDCVKKNECVASFPIVPACTCSDIPPAVSMRRGNHALPCILLESAILSCKMQSETPDAVVEGC